MKIYNDDSLYDNNSSSIEEEVEREDVSDIERIRSINDYDDEWEIKYRELDKLYSDNSNNHEDIITLVR